VALDTTVAGAAATSYLTLAEADAMAATDLGRDVLVWSAATDAEKEAALVRAAIDLDVYKPGAETRHAATQGRRFPRSFDIDGVGLPFLPLRLKEATWAQAKHRLANADAFVEARSRRARGYSSFSGDDGSASMSLHPDLETVSLEAQRLMDDVLGIQDTSLGQHRFRAVQMASADTDPADEW
jgi:hypothetical protein